MSDETNDLRDQKMVRTEVISFRLDEMQFSELRAALKKDKTIGVFSECGLARKIVSDFLVGRMRYLDDTDRQLDLEKYAASANPPKAIGPSCPPTYMRYAKVERILATEPGFAKLLAPKTDIVYRPDGRMMRCSSFVIRVTKTLHQSGKDAQLATKKEIIQTAIALRQSS
jgi:hypothetical protein